MSGGELYHGTPDPAATRQERELAALKTDAGNRAVRTFWQGLAIDVGVGVAVLAYSVASDPSPLAWAAVGASFARTIVQSGASYVMRRFLDRSRVPTPLPPGDAG